MPPQRRSPWDRDRGGGIFNFLPQAGIDHFEELFATPQGVDLAQLAAVHGISSAPVTKADDLMPAVQRAIDAGGVRLIVVPTDRAENVKRHREAFAAVSIPG